MSIFVTTTGFQKKTLPEIKTELETSFQGVFGSEIDLSAEGPYGQIIGILAKDYADLWDGAEEIYNARNPNEATGKSLDDISAETGVTRIDESPTIVENVTLFGDEGTPVPLGSKAKQPNNELTFSLTVNTTITKTAARYIEIEPNISFPASGGEVFTVTIDAVPYTYNAIAADTKKIVIDALVVLITAGAWTGVSSNVDDDYLKLLNVVVDFSASWVGTFDLNLLGSGGDFEADENGPSTVPTDTLTEIATPVTNWDSVNNSVAGTTGRAVETDAELRVRRKQAFLTGNAVEEAIRSKLLQDVDGITTVTITSNRTTAIDSSGRPAKSFECVVEGGDNDDIANKIWEVMPAGIEPYGNTSIVIQDSTGRNQTVGFSRPVAVYIHVKVKRDFYDEEIYPANGDQAIKDAIVAWALTKFEPGTDVIRQRIGDPVYTVPGIGDIEISIDGTPNPGDTPTYALANEPINGREIADFDTTRIVVEVLTP